jgi:hypothetical protein
MSTLDEPFGRLWVDASNGYGKCGREQETSRFILAEADLGYDFDVVISGVVASLSTHSEKCILKAGCIPAGRDQPHPKPCAWTADPDAIIAKVRRGNRRSRASGSLS